MARAAHLPGVDDRSGPDPIIVHVDMDCFYAACERLREPALRGEPVVIGMGYDKDEPHGAVATASYEARYFGVESAMPIPTALERLPRRLDLDEEAEIDPDETGYYRPVDMAYYKSISRDVREVLDAHADVLEPVSIDEAYLDVTERCSWDEADDFARSLKRRIESEVGVPTSIGVAPTKSGAKVASDHDKPDGLVVIRPGEVRAFFESLPIEAVHGIGPVTADGLRDLGIETAGDLAASDPDELEDAFGIRGREFYNRARGIDPRSVSPPDDPKSLSKESSTGDPISEWKPKEQLVRDRAQAVATRAHERDALYQTIGIKVVTPPFDVHTRDHSLSGPVDDPDVVESVAVDLLAEFADDSIRKLGVRLSNLSFSADQQATLGDWDGPPTATVGDFARTYRRPTRRNRQSTLSDFVR